METTRLIELPIEMLWEYRMHKVNSIYASNNRVVPVNTYEVDEIAEHISIHGMEPVQLTVAGTQALLNDGNHRIAAARQLGYTHVPVHIIVFPVRAEKVFLPEMLNQFKPLSDKLASVLRELFYNYKM